MNIKLNMGKHCGHDRRNIGVQAEAKHSLKQTEVDDLDTRTTLLGLRNLLTNALGFKQENFWQMLSIAYYAEYVRKSHGKVRHNFVFGCFHNQPIGIVATHRTWDLDQWYFCVNMTWTNDF